MKQILFSRAFPVGHPRAGEPTHFVEKIYNSFNVEALGETFYMPFEDDLHQINRMVDLNTWELISEFKKSLQHRTKFTYKKYHTIRAGHRWKEGEWFAPKVWSGKPYRSKCIQFAPPIQIKKLYEIEIDINGVVALDGYYPEDEDIMAKMASNDGLSEYDFHHWFNKLPFSGQVICWNENIQY